MTKAADVSSTETNEQEKAELAHVKTEKLEGESSLDVLRRKANELRSQLRVIERSFERQLDAAGLPKSEADEMRNEWDAIHAELDAAQQELAGLMLEDQGILRVTETGEVYEPRDEAAMKILEQYRYAPASTWDSEVAAFREAGFAENEIPMAVLNFGKDQDIINMVTHLDQFPTEIRKAFTIALAEKHYSLFKYLVYKLHDIPLSLMQPDEETASSMMWYTNHFEGGKDAVMRFLIDNGLAFMIFKEYIGVNFPIDIATHLIKSGEIDLLLEQYKYFDNKIELLLEIKRLAPEKASDTIKELFSQYRMNHTRFTNAEYRLFRDQLKNDPEIHQDAINKFLYNLTQPEIAKKIAENYALDESEQQKGFLEFASGFISKIMELRFTARRPDDASYETGKRAYLKILRAFTAAFDVSRDTLRDAFIQNMSPDRMSEHRPDLDLEEWANMAREIGDPELADRLSTISEFVKAGNMSPYPFIMKGKAVRMPEEKLKQYSDLVATLPTSQHLVAFSGAFAEYVGSEPTKERAQFIRNLSESVEDSDYKFSLVWEKYKNELVAATPERQADFISALSQMNDRIKGMSLAADLFKLIMEEDSRYFHASPEKRSDFLAIVEQAFASLGERDIHKLQTYWENRELFMDVTPEKRDQFFTFMTDFDRQFPMKLTMMQPIIFLYKKYRLADLPLEEQLTWLSFNKEIYDVLEGQENLFKTVWTENDSLAKATPEQRKEWISHFRQVIETLGPDGNEEMLKFALKGKGTVEISHLKRAARIFGEMLTKENFLKVQALYEGQIAPEFESLSVKKTGEAGALEVERKLRTFRHDFLFTETSDPKTMDVAKSSIGRAMLINLTRFEEGHWGQRNDEAWNLMVSNYQARLERGSFAPLPEEYKPSEALRVSILDKEASDTFAYSQGFLDRFKTLTGDLAEAQRLVREHPEGGAGAELVLNLIESVKRQIEENRTKMVRYEALIANPSLAENPKEAKGAAFALKNLKAKQAALEKATDMLDPKTWNEGRAQELFSLLADVPETASDLRRLVFTYSLYLNPTFQAERFGENPEKPSDGDISRVTEFVDHVTNQETFRQYFTDDKARKKFDSLCNVSALEQEAARLRSFRQTAGTTTFAFVPSRDFKTEISGHMADACWAGKEASILEAHPNFVSLTFVQNPGHEIHERVAGACMLIETEAEDGTPLLVIRGLNPIENVSTQIDAADFFDKLTNYLKPIAEARGRELCVVVDDHRGGSASNRQSVFNFLSQAVSKRGWTRMPLKSATDTTFNDYDITNNTFLIEMKPQEMAEAA